ncbi:HAD family hydrolase [Pseudomonas fluorescens]|uniref:HAD family hydrolase n=1 Tax=Pseudomonas sp. MH9.3 TaxID=3048630 RepID=UPI0010BF7F83|nr:HAD family hydrolase [Pseudomonas sp. MH9.3]MEB0109410.1 HAD family hydrolase [Pseudomonas sp. MH9.3]TKK12537.1 HAD family hydrolase [Pseudomonas fluorescens]WPX77660.1 HAD family hydrolase [Pseudomonas sp. MH9.3]WQG59587.1 HAD family hydrolase [Pseudomonas sp. RTB3]
MPIPAVIFDAFGTLIKISKGSSPYRKILKIGIEQGRRPQPRDGEYILSLPMDLRQAADFFGISIDPSVMGCLESGLNRELADIQAYSDGIHAVRLLQDAGVKVAVCSNLAKPYAAAIERLYPTLDGYSYSFEIGAVKPSFKIYSHAIHAVSASPTEVWMIGDSKECDCDGPSAFGMRGFWLDRQGRSIYGSLDQFAEAALGY